MRGVYEATAERFQTAESEARRDLRQKLQLAGGPKHAWEFCPAEGADRGSFDRAFSSKLGRRTYPAAAVIFGRLRGRLLG